MPFSPFNANDFALMQQVREGQPLPQPLQSKVEDLRRDLCSFPEYDLEFFRKRIVRRSMRGDKGMVFGPPRTDDEHWFLYTVGGDQDEVQLNIGMCPDYIRVGLGFQIGRQVAPKIPAFRVFQTFLGVRPPLPFRAAFYHCVARNDFGIEIQGDPKKVGPDDVLRYLETYVVPEDGSPVFVFVGALWDVQEAANKTIEAYREVFLKLMPFYEELLLAGGRYVFYSP